MARPDSRSQDLESRASWVGPGPAGRRTPRSWVVFIESLNSGAHAAGRGGEHPSSPAFILPTPLLI